MTAYVVCVAFLGEDWDQAVVLEAQGSGGAMSEDEALALELSLWDLELDDEEAQEIQAALPAGFKDVPRKPHRVWIEAVA